MVLGARGMAVGRVERLETRDEGRESRVERLETRGGRGEAARFVPRETSAAVCLFHVKHAVYQIRVVVVSREVRSFGAGPYADVLVAMVDLGPDQVQAVEKP